MKIFLYFILSAILFITSIFFGYLWISTTKYRVDNEEYTQRFSLPYRLEFTYHDYIYGGITICDDDEKIILSSGTKVGVKQIEVKQLLCYNTFSREKVLFKFLDGSNKIHYCSINKFHTVTYEQNVYSDKCTELLDVLRWIRFKESLLSKNYELFTCALLLLLIANITTIRKLKTKTL